MSYFNACQNKNCDFFEKKLRGNIVKYGVLKNGNERFKCKNCGKTFVKTSGTIHFYKHISQEEIKIMCTLFLSKLSFREISRRTNRHLDTVRTLFHRLADNMHELKDYFKEIGFSKQEIKALSDNIKKKTKKTFKNKTDIL